MNRDSGDPANVVPTYHPVTLEVFANLFSSVAEEMGTALCRAALSPNIKERRNFSCLVCDKAGELVAQAAHIPVHLGGAPLSVTEVLRTVPMEQGDVVMLNDPFMGGTHLPDLTMVAPVFLNDAPAPIFYVANRAHHADVGGTAAGSMPVSDEIFQEGIVIPPLRLVKRGILDRDVLSLFLANVRTPREREGDIQAQIASLNIGIRRLQEIARSRSAQAMVLYSDALVETFCVRRGSGGRGKHPGGDGIRRDVCVLRPATVTLITERRRIPPYGLAGGSPGACGKNVLIRIDGSVTELPAKISFRAEAGDIISVRTPGGGARGEENVDRSNDRQ